MASSEINAESVVSHIIESSTSASLFSYFGEVFISSSSNSKSSATIEKLKDELKAAFRKYARIIHPDKCTSPLANKAFVKLKDAYDELLNNISTTVVNNRSEGVQSKKRQQQDQTYSSDDARTRYMLRRQMRKQFAEEKHSIEEDIENFLNSVDVESHSNNWNSFISKSKKQKFSDQDTNTKIDQPAQDTGDNVPSCEAEASSQPQELATYICYLCERKFPSLEKQERHIAESALHLKNLQLLQKKQNS